MVERYYLMSKDLGDGPHLIGELSRLRKDEYQFRYMISADQFPQWFMQIPRFWDIRRTYETEEVMWLIINRLVPSEGSWAADALMQQNGIEQYDEWDLLESLIEQYEQYQLDTQPLCDSHQLFYFYKQIPANAHRYDS